MFCFETVMIFCAFLRRDFLIVFLIGLSLNGSCSVVMIGVLVRFPARYAKRPLAGFQTWMCMRSILCSLIMFLRCLICVGSFLCLMGSLIVVISSFSRFAASLSRLSYGPRQTIGLNFLRSRNLASRYI